MCYSLSDNKLCIKTNERILHLFNGVT